MMSRLLFVMLCLPTLASAKPWQGLEPGLANELDVLGKFGEPTKSLDARGKRVLVYSEKKAIKGTVQAQFKIDPATKIVERIDVYPEPYLDADTIEKTYGPDCTAEGATNPCYQRKEAEGGRVYYLYARLGLAIFFKDDNRQVQSFAFLPNKR